MLQRLRSRFNREEGFTLIELLVVILIIGILAAIAIPSFLNQTEKGDDASAKSTVRSAQTSAETFFTNERSYAAMTLAELQEIEDSLPDDLTVAGPGAAAAPTADGYRLALTSESGITYTVNKDGATVTFPCSDPGEGGCPDSGVWGGEAPEEEG